MNESKPLGLYIHIPFCRQKCGYCDFYSLSGSEERMDAYCKALLAHLTETAPQAAKHSVDTVYFGGGTPSLLGEKRLREILKCIDKRYEQFYSAVRNHRNKRNKCINDSINYARKHFANSVNYLRQCIDKRGE